MSILSCRQADEHIWTDDGNEIDVVVVIFSIQELVSML